MPKKPEKTPKSSRPLSLKDLKTKENIYFLKLWFNAGRKSHSIAQIAVPREKSGQDANKNGARFASGHSQQNESTNSKKASKRCSGRCSSR